MTPAPRRDDRITSWRADRAVTAGTTFGAVLAPAAARAQGGDGDLGVNQFLELFGLPCSLVAGLALLLVLWHVISIVLGTRLAGLRASFGHALLTFITAVGLLIPVSGAFAVLRPELGAGTQAVLSQVLVAAAEITAIKLLYRADLGRALLGFLTASVLTASGAAVVLVLVF